MLRPAVRERRIWLREPSRFSNKPYGARQALAREFPKQARKMLWGSVSRQILAGAARSEPT